MKNVAGSFENDARFNRQSSNDKRFVMRFSWELFFFIFSEFILILIRISLNNDKILCTDKQIDASGWRAKKNHPNWYLYKEIALFLFYKLNNYNSQSCNVKLIGPLYNKQKNKSTSDIKVMELNKIKRTMARFKFCLSQEKGRANKTSIVLFVSMQKQWKFVWILYYVCLNTKKNVRKFAYERLKQLNIVQCNQMKRNIKIMCIKCI